MNEGVISSYDNFFSGSGLPPDLAADVAMTTSIHASLENDYQHTEGTDQQIRHQNPRRYHHHPSSTPATFSNPVDVTMQTVNNATQINFSGVASSNNSVQQGLFTQIPFVQIHTTDVQPQREFNSTRFRRNASSNHEEIKAEPIKSENAEGAKDRINATPTPPSAVQQRSDSLAPKNLLPNEKNTCTNKGIADFNVSSEIVTNVPCCDNTVASSHDSNIFTFPNIFKCQYCAFICLSQNGLEVHLDAMHQKHFNSCENALKRVSIQCPGCDNIFYAFTSIQTHLKEDHLMTAKDIAELMHAIKKKSQTPDNLISTPNNGKNVESVESNDNTMNGTQRRSRIYLKNVECLREPNRDPIEQQDNLFTDSLFHFENDDCNSLVNIGCISMEEQDLIGMLTSSETPFHNTINNSNQNHKTTNENTENYDKSIENIPNDTITPTTELNKRTNPPSKQKISIKSVDVLREPALLRRDYEIQTFGDFMNVCNDLNLHIANNNNCNTTNNCDMGGERTNNMEVQYPIATNKEPLLNNNNENGITNYEQRYEKQRKPKIYIKNVDILKEPMTFSNTLNAPNTAESSSNPVMNFNFMSQTLQQSSNSYLDTVEGLNATVPTFNGVGTSGGAAGGMSQLPLGTISEQYLFDSGGVSNFMSNTITSNADSYIYNNETNADNFIMDTNRFTDTITPIITEPTPPPQPPQPPPLPLPLPTSITNLTGSTNISNSGETTSTVVHTTPTVAMATIQKQKIFIKNVDILKEPQYQEPRGLLHLRTVDELNLMNRKEVENLIAPNLESNQTNVIEDDLSDNFQQLNTANSGESLSAADDNCNDNNVIEQISYECESFKLNSFANTQNAWHDDYDLGEDIRDIITSTMAPSLSTTQNIIHDLDTPQMSLISIPDIEELTGTRLQINVSPELEVRTETAVATTVAAHQQQDSTNFPYECEIITTTTDNTIQETTTICSADNVLNNNGTAIFNLTALTELEKDVTTTATLTKNHQFPSSSSDALKQERLNQATPIGEETQTVSPQNNKNKNAITNFDNIPPLTAMSSSSTYTALNQIEVAVSNSVPSGLPVPPLVPMLPPIQLPSKAAIVTSNDTVPAERGRIYVANNLLQAPSSSRNTITSTSSNNTLQAYTTTFTDKTFTGKEKTTSKTPIAAVSVMGGTSVRGRPFGANRTGVKKQHKQMGPNINGAGVYLKCTVAGCAFRFKKSATIDYHIKCHTSDSQPQSMACPECKLPITNWNSLHTHLWRSHKIDMELYSCQLCTFKTPIYSRLLNTHSKIHYDERNYKCDQCEKAFKNTKQLKNHRRWHRKHNKTTSFTSKPESTKKSQARIAEKEKLEPTKKGPTITVSLATQITSNTTTIVTTTAGSSSMPVRNFYRCNDCDAVFSYQKTFREHLCKNAAAAVQCEVCDRVLTSRSSLKLHMQSHESSRRFKCNNCDYSTSDHNAFRRHKMTHDNNNAKMYTCVHCDYKSIQSVAYQKHVQLKHPQFADSIVYKCKTCPYATINKALYDVHKIKHENLNGKNETLPTLKPTTENFSNGIEKNCNNNKSVSCTNAEQAAIPKTKIKVKSHLLLTTPVVDSSMEFNDICFDAITIPV